jgi:adenylate cyclase
LLQKAGEDEPEERRMRFRIGVNVGDVMVKDADLVGDGVNVAARLEGFINGGEICVSRGCYLVSSGQARCVDRRRRTQG